MSARRSIITSIIDSIRLQRRIGSKCMPPWFNPTRCTQMEEGNDDDVQQVEAILAANGGALLWGRLTNLATLAGVKLPQLKKLKQLPGFSGGGETKKPINPRNQ